MAPGVHTVLRKIREMKGDLFVYAQGFQIFNYSRVPTTYTQKREDDWGVRDEGFAFRSNPGFGINQEMRML